MNDQNPRILKSQDAIRHIAKVGNLPVSPQKLVILSKRVTVNGSRRVEQRVVFKANVEMLGCAISQCIVDNPGFAETLRGALAELEHSTAEIEKTAQSGDAYLEVDPSFDPQYELAIAIDSNARAGMTSTNLTAERLHLTLLYLYLQKRDTFDNLLDAILTGFQLLEVIERDIANQSNAKRGDIT